MYTYVCASTYLSTVVRKSASYVFATLLCIWDWCFEMNWHLFYTWIVEIDWFKKCDCPCPGKWHEIEILFSFKVESVISFFTFLDKWLVSVLNILLNQILSLLSKWQCSGIEIFVICLLTSWNHYLKGLSKDQSRWVCIIYRIWERWSDFWKSLTKIPKCKGQVQNKFFVIYRIWKR